MAKRKSAPEIVAPKSKKPSTPARSAVNEEKRDAADNRKFMIILSVSTVFLVLLLWLLSK
jgi:hypothetical protein